MSLFSRSYEFSGEDPDVFLGLLGLGGVPLCPPVCLNNEGFGFALSKLHVCDITVELASVRPYELIALPDLERRQLRAHLCVRGGVQTWAWGSGLKKTALMDSMLAAAHAETELCSKDLEPDPVCKRGIRQAPLQRLCLCLRLRLKAFMGRSRSLSLAD